MKVERVIDIINGTLEEVKKLNFKEMYFCKFNIIHTTKPYKTFEGYTTVDKFKDSGLITDNMGEFLDYIEKSPSINRNERFGILCTLAGVNAIAVLPIAYFRRRLRRDKRLSVSYLLPQAINSEDVTVGKGMSVIDFIKKRNLNKLLNGL